MVDPTCQAKACEEFLELLVIYRIEKLSLRKFIQRNMILELDFYQKTSLAKQNIKYLIKDVPLKCSRTEKGSENQSLFVMLFTSISKSNHQSQIDSNT